jgi:hypothetical protein
MARGQGYNESWARPVSPDVPEERGPWDWVQGLVGHENAPRVWIVRGPRGHRLITNRTARVIAHAEALRRQLEVELGCSLDDAGFERRTFAPADPMRIEAAS